MITAHIIITPKRTVLDPQGEAVKRALHSLGLDKIREVRVGKFIEMEIEGASSEALQDKLESACHDLLSNPVIEDYLLNIDVTEASEPGVHSGPAEPDEESLSDLTRLEARPKKAAKKLAKAAARAGAGTAPVPPAPKVKPPKTSEKSGSKSETKSKGTTSSPSAGTTKNSPKAALKPILKAGKKAAQTTKKTKGSLESGE